MKEIYIARSSEVASRVLDGEIVIMSATDSTLFSLSEVATVIWQAADGRTPLSEIVRNRICAEFDVAPDAASRDAEAFVEDLERHGILRVSSEPIIADQPAPGIPAGSSAARTA
ncbi:MAG: PqqD family protein [Candidatus Acidiferrales bacterium]